MATSNGAVAHTRSAAAAAHAVQAPPRKRTQASPAAPSTCGVPDTDNVTTRMRSTGLAKIDPNRIRPPRDPESQLAADKAAPSYSNTKKNHAKMPAPSAATFFSVADDTAAAIDRNTMASTAAATTKNPKETRPSAPFPSATTMAPADSPMTIATINAEHSPSQRPTSTIVRLIG